MEPFPGFELYIRRGPGRARNSQQRNKASEETCRTDDGSHAYGYGDDVAAADRCQSKDYYIYTYIFSWLRRMYFTSILIWYFVSMLYLINIHHCIFIQYLILSSSQWCIWSICVTTYLVLSCVGQVLEVYGLVKIRRWWTDSDDSARAAVSGWSIYNIISSNGKCWKCIWSS